MAAHNEQEFVIILGIAPRSGTNFFCDLLTRHPDCEPVRTIWEDFLVANADKLQRLENIRIPDDFDYQAVNSLSTEARQKLDGIRPATISQASRISGVSPSDISVLLVYLGR